MSVIERGKDISVKNVIFYTKLQQHIQIKINTGAIMF
jgi:hypothetical protein